MECAFESKVAVVTSVAKGIGRCFREEFEKQGMFRRFAGQFRFRVRDQHHQYLLQSGSYETAPIGGLHRS